MRYLIPLLILATLSSASADTPTKEKEDKLVCAKISDVTKIMNDKQFYHLLNMNNKNGVTETIWVGGTDIVITAQDKESSCVIAMMKEVVYDPDTLQGLVKAYEIQQKKQKDI